jgi:hypothetical protein
MTLSKLAQAMINGDPEALAPPVQGEDETAEDFAARQEAYAEAHAIYQAEHEDDEKTRMRNAAARAEEDNAWSMAEESQ